MDILRFGAAQSRKLINNHTRKHQNGNDSNKRNTKNRNKKKKNKKKKKKCKNINNSTSEPWGRVSRAPHFRSLTDTVEMLARPASTIHLSSLVYITQ